MKLSGFAGYSATAPFSYVTNNMLSNKLSVISEQVIISLLIQVTIVTV